MKATIKKPYLLRKRKCYNAQRIMWIERIFHDANERK